MSKFGVFGLRVSGAKDFVFTVSDCVLSVVWMLLVV